MSAVVIISNGLLLYKRHIKGFKLHGVYVSSVADRGRTKNVLHLNQNATDCNRT